MFILRRISSEGVQMNQEIGNGYTLIDRFTNYEGFCRSFEIHFGKKHVADLDETADKDTKNVYMFVGNGSFIP